MATAAVEFISEKIGENATRTKYHLDRLEKLKLIRLVIGISPMGAYAFTSKGREYVVENNLDRD